MLSLIDAGEAGLARARDASASRSSKMHRLQDVEVLAPLPAPRGNVIAIGRNYQAHAEESARAAGKAVDPPTVFTKAVTTVAGPYDDVVIDPGVTTKGTPTLADWATAMGTKAILISEVPLSQVQILALQRERALAGLELVCRQSSIDD